MVPGINVDYLAGDTLQQDIRSWLSPPDPWKNHNIAHGSRYNGTGEWFLHSDTLPEWKTAGPSSLLWIHGKRRLPLSAHSFAKTDVRPLSQLAQERVCFGALTPQYSLLELTVLVSSAIIQEIEVLRKSGLASLAFYYHDFREDQKKDLRGLVSSVLFQLCDQSDSYYDILLNFYSTHRRGAQHPSNDGLLRCLKDLLGLSGQAPVYLIIDALDECPNTSTMPSPREEILMLVEQLVESQLMNLRLCVTSRPEIDIKIVLGPLAFHSISIHDESGQLEDIENYIRSTVNTDQKNQRWKKEDKELVIKALAERADGM